MARRASTNDNIDGDEPCEAPLDPAVYEYIGRELRAVYDGVLSKPIPQRFITLLNRLEGEPICVKEAHETRGDLFEAIRGRIGG